MRKPMVSWCLVLSGLLWAGACAYEGGEEPDAAPADATAIADPAMAGDLPNPAAEVMADWADLPDGREWGSTAGVDIDPNDGHIWAYDRCGGVGLAGGCAENLVDPIFKFHRETGEILASFGAGLFVLPHGIHVDAESNVWVTGLAGDPGRHQGSPGDQVQPRGRGAADAGTGGNER